MLYHFDRKKASCSSPEINSGKIIYYDRRGKNLFKALIILYGQETSLDKSILGNIVGCYQNRNSSQTFCGDNVISKVQKKTSLVESLFN